MRALRIAFRCRVRVGRQDPGRRAWRTPQGDFSPQQRHLLAVPGFAAQPRGPGDRDHDREPRRSPRARALLPHARRAGTAANCTPRAVSDLLRATRLVLRYDVGRRATGGIVTTRARAAVTMPERQQAGAARAGTADDPGKTI